MTKRLWKFLAFTLVHSLRDMARNRSRTSFALVCVATGVSAVVALRSLAFMVGDELTTNIAQLNRGDIRLYASPDVPEAVELSEQGNPLWRAEAVSVIQDWAREEGAEVSLGRMEWFTQLAPLVGDEEPTSRLTPVMFIDPATYPFYDTIFLTEPAGVTLGDLLASYAGSSGTDADPRALVISNNLARESGLALRVGDRVRLGASTTVFEVRGIAPGSAESVLTNPAPAFLGNYAYATLADLPLVGERPLPDHIFLKIPLGQDITRAEKELIHRLEHELRARTDFDEEMNRATVPELEAQNSETADVIDDMILVMGLSSLLIGGIGIINTMLVVVSRRTLEVAVLKTLGLKAYRVTILFLVEALLMGLIGSVAGVALGVVLSYVIRGVGEEAFAITLNWRIYPEAILSGLFLGILITGLFGFLPTLVAGQVRPAIVLRPNEAQTPPAGLIQVLITLGVMIVVLGLMVSSIVEGAFYYGPVFMIAGGLALVGLFGGVIVANTRLGQPIPHAPRALRMLRQGVLIYGAVAVSAVLASVIILILSEVWQPFGLGSDQPANDVIAALGERQWGWAAFWLGLAAGLGWLIRRQARGFAGLIGLGSLGVTLGGLGGFLAGSILERLIGGGPVWDLLAEMSTGIVLVEGALALLAAVFVGYWVLVWAVGRLSPVLLLGVVSLMILALVAGLIGVILLAAGTGVPTLVLALPGAVVFVALWWMLRRRYRIDGRLVLREMSGRRGRIASTLLGLSVGVTGLSVIALTAGGVSHLLETQLDRGAEGNLLIFDPTSRRGEDVIEVLEGLEGVRSFSQVTTYEGILIAHNGKTVEPLGRDERPEETEDPAENSTRERREVGIPLGLTLRKTLEDMPDYRMTAGRALEPGDEGQALVMLRESFITHELGIEPGDRLMMLFENGLGEADDMVLQFRVIGLISRQSEQTGLEELGNLSILPPRALPGRVNADGTATIAQIDESDDVYMDRALVAISRVPGVVAIELSAITQLIQSLLDQLTAIPTLVAWLALVAGTAIIANTVALATQERRRQIGVMKAVGLKGRRVLGMLVIENGLIGLIAGVIGVSVGLTLTVVLVLVSPSSADVMDLVEFDTMGWLIVMSIAVAIGAAALSAWSAAAEKPMNVLRYE